MTAEYREQLEYKTQQTLQQFSRFGVDRLDVIPSPSSAYRMRAEFKIWHQAGDIHYAMHKPGSNKNAYCIDQFAIGSTTIQSLMPALLEYLRPRDELRHRLFQVEFLTSTRGEALVTLVYHRPLDDAWPAAAQQLAHALNIHVVGRSRKQKRVIGQDYIHESMTVLDEEFIYQQLESSFTQPNAGICEKMLNWVADYCQSLKGDLLELYCGNGNFTLPLARRFNKVLATEIAKSSIESARYNCSLNDVNNITFVRMSSEELTQAMRGDRAFNRLQGVDLSGYQFSTVLVDPPRSGLDEGTNALVQTFDTIIYISCNPETLADNLVRLSKTHRAVKMALFDQFPSTPHREVAMILEKKA